MGNGIDMADPQEVPGATDPPRRSTRVAYLHKKSQEQEQDRSRHSRGLRSIKSTWSFPAPSYTGPRRPHWMFEPVHNRKFKNVAANGLRSSIDVPLQETETWKDDDGYICTNNSAAWKDYSFSPTYSKHFQKYNTFPCPPGCPDNLYMCTIKQNGRTDRYWKLFNRGEGFWRRQLPFMDCDSKGNHMQGVDQVVLRSKVAVDKYIVQKWQWMSTSSDLKRDPGSVVESSPK